MKPQTVFFILLVSIIGCFVQVFGQSDEIYFPGPTDRPDRYPLPSRPTRPTRPTPSPTPRPTRPSTTSTTSTTSPNEVTSRRPTQEEYNACVNRCQVTSEYNPVCGSDNVVYSNPGRLNCARRCGNPVTEVKKGQCVENPRG